MVRRSLRPEVAYIPIRKTTAQIAQKSNNWAGNNYLRWSNKDYDAAIEGLKTELDPAKRAALFVPFLFIFLSIQKHPLAIPSRAGISILYAAVFVPMFFFVDRMAYRTYQRRVERG